jgi:hypothetical protein
MPGADKQSNRDHHRFRNHLTCARANVWGANGNSPFSRVASPIRTACLRAPPPRKPRRDGPLLSRQRPGKPCRGRKRISERATCNARRCRLSPFAGARDMQRAQADLHASSAPLVKIGEISGHWQRQRRRQFRRCRAQLQGCSRNGRAGSVALLSATPSQGDAAPPCQNRRLMTGIQL